MSSDLQSTKLESLITFSNGRSSPDRSDDRAFPVFGSNGLIGWADETNSPANSIVIGRVGSYCGSVHFSTSPCWVTDNAIRATAKGENDPSFLYYLLKQLDLNNWRSGSGQPLINQATLNSIEVTVPGPSSQKRIGDFVSSLDNRITLLRETNATLEAIAQALFKSWFVDFDPVRAKAEGSQPEGMDAATAALFPDRFEESELGLVPRGWRVGSILDIANLLSGGTPKTDRTEYWGGDIPWASAKDVSQSGNSILTVTERTITELGLQQSSTRIIPPFSTVLVARGATTGRMVMFGKAMAMNQTCYALESKANTPAALFLVLKNEINALTQKAHGSVFDTITTSTFSTTKTLLIPDSLLACFESVAGPLFHRMLAGTQQAKTLTQLRDTLLPRLISGQLRLSEAEALVAEAAGA